MSRVAGRTWLAVAFLAASFAFIAVVAPPPAQAEETVWICKPGQSDDLCAGTIEGSKLPAPGQAAESLGYTRPDEAPVDCFYLYPTQSEQPTPNSNLDKDPPIRRVVVQQARMFSTVCNVYAPMYRQVTYSGNQVVHNPDVDVAYNSAKDAFEDFLQNYNKDRGFIMIGHSQGSAHTARLIDELVDTDPELRQRFVGAIAPGANISVPIGQDRGGLFENVPACSQWNTWGCVVAYSTYSDVPGPTAQFSRLDYGYWIYPEPRPDPSRFEAMCVNPAQLDGSEGVLKPLVNFDYLTGVPAGPESAAPWVGLPDYYTAECKSQGGAHWLNIAKLNLEGDDRPDFGALVASGTNYHVPELNLAEGNLLAIAGNQAAVYDGIQDQIARTRGLIKSTNAKIAKTKKRIAAGKKKAKKLGKKARKAKGKRKKVLRKKARKARKKVAAERKRLKNQRGRLSSLQKQLAELPNQNHA